MLDTRTVGPALRHARELADLDERRAARRLGVPLSELRAWEQNGLTPDATDLIRAARNYSSDLDDDVREALVPRVPLTSPEQPGVLVVGDELVELGDLAAEEPRRRNRLVLRRFVAAVRRQRGLPAEAAVELRSTDLAALADALHVTDEELAVQLADVLGLPPASAHGANRALVAVALVALAASGAVPSMWTSAAQDAGRPIDVVASPFSTSAEHSPATVPLFAPLQARRT
jgi:transcriptional regulator with XRE-family HTH domain